MTLHEEIKDAKWAVFHHLISKHSLKIKFSLYFPYELLMSLRNIIQFCRIDRQLHALQIKV